MARESRPAIAIDAHAIQSAVYDLERLQLNKRLFQHMTEQHADDAAVGDDQHPPPGVFNDDIVPGIEHARLELRQRFTPGRRVVERIVPEAGEGIGIGCQQFGGGTAFPIAEVYFHQTCVE